ncbi:hypothetical protein FRX31_005093 [Thalictrum thalictroides]|uniref:Uncharacterized protein n=1 Tax=Thalictrum thalictroides TaxID=46969 RepID=A0A7J6X7E9_THATH|nr:hypothetical protein FRX31_005093 [Thalictrum thalictroides]
MAPRRKKWTEEEERTLIEKYGEMLSNGTLVKMKTREKKFRPIAAQVNSLHHNLDPIAFPWQWSWKDASTKVQNMRHQYLLVKQKIKKPPTVVVDVGVSGDIQHQEDVEENGLEAEEQFDWVEGISHWPNFLRYKNVFGDLPLGGFNSNNDNIDLIHRENEHNFGSVGIDLGDYGRFGTSPGEDGFGVDIDGGENGVLELEYYGGENNGNNEDINGSHRIQDDGDDGIEYEDVFASGSQLKKKRKKLKRLEKRAWMALGNRFSELREREARFEDREVERERKRHRREQVWARLEQERKRKLDDREKEREERERARERMRRERNRELETMEHESAERERRRREEELNMEREWENRMEQRRLDWKNRIADMLSQHRAAMDDMQSRILHDQQNLTNQLLGLLTQWTGHPSGISDHTGAGNPYLSQMLQNMHHMTGIVHSEDNRVEGDNHDDNFIVDDG